MAIKLDANKRAVMQKIIEESRLDELVSIVVKLEDDVRAEVLKAISKQLNLQSKNSTLTAIKRIIKGSDQQIKDWIVTAVADSYAAGANLAYLDIKKLSVSVGGDSGVLLEEFTADKIRQIDLLSVHKEAVNALVSDTYLDFANGMNGLVKGVEHQLNDAIKRQIRAQAIAGQLTGRSMANISKEVREVLGNQGFSVLVDRGGRSWSLKQYAEMLVRTHVMKSANEGSINRYLDFNLDIIQISTHTGSCPICKPYEGKIYSISGNADKYPKLDVQPPYHPHCRHTFLPRPDLQGGEDLVSDPTDDNEEELGFEFERGSGR